MSIKEAEIQVSKFLESNSEKVMVIRGEWGVGKTFFWDTKLNQYKDTIESVKKYSYVSLFGADQIERIKNAIFENAIDKKIIGVQASIETFFENITSFSKIYGKRAGSVGINLLPPFLAKWLPQDISPLYSVPFLAIQDTLICLDDFERKHESLNTNKILGLISELKNQNKCKIVLILNDEKISSGEKSSYEELREKVIDREIHFNPTPNECADIVFNTDKISAKIKEFTNSLNIKNIRILFKIKELSTEVLTYLSKYSEDIRYKALHSLVLFCYCSSVKKDNIPTQDQLRQVDYGIFISVDPIDKSSDKVAQRKWINMLQDYGYRKTEDFDLVILEAISNGYIDQHRLIIEADKLSIIDAENQSKNSFRDGWNLYHDSFDLNEDLVIKSIYEADLPGFLVPKLSREICSNC